MTIEIQPYQNRRGTRLRLQGKRFGMLRAIAPGPDQYYGPPERKRKHSTWVCACDCGVKTVVLTCNLTKPNTRSCGLHTNRTGGRVARVVGMVGV